MPRILALAVLVAALFPGPAAGAQMSVIVIPDEDMRRMEQLSREGAVGILVPDAGPETSFRRALAALRRGEVRNSLLGGEPGGQVLVDKVWRLPDWRLDGPKIVVGLPGPSTRPNDRRYPIAVIAPGYRGLLTSDSTRIPGLVSIVDVAPTSLGRGGKLGSTPESDPIATLRDLDRRIAEHREPKMSLLLLSLVLIAALAVVRPRAVLPAFAAILVANLVLAVVGWTGIWPALLTTLLLVVASLPFARLPLVAHGLLLAGVLGAHLLAMGIDERWVALSPFGPTQNARFYGLSNLLATLLLVPALAGAAILGRAFGLWAFAAVAALAFVTVGGTQFGADGGGVVVLLAAYAVLIALEQRLTVRTLVWAASVFAVLAAALVAGAGSHVTDALGDGPAGLAEDLWRRLRLSWLRATASWSVGLVVWSGVVALVVLAVRERRPLLLAYLAALAVSLVVNDSPYDVIVAGVAGWLALSTAPGVARPAGEPARPAEPEPRARTAPAASP